MQDEDRVVSDRDASGDRACADTVAGGHYDRRAVGLSGRYDNVRTFWEDRLTRLPLGPFVRECDRAARTLGLGMRPCGAGRPAARRRVWRGHVTAS